MAFTTERPFTGNVDALVDPASMPDDAEPRAEQQDEGRRHLAGSDAFARYSGMGLTFALTVLVFGAGGWWIDSKLSTTPIFLILFVLAGFAGGLISMVKRLPPARKRDQPPGG